MPLSSETISNLDLIHMMLKCIYKAATEDRSSWRCNIATSCQAIVMSKHCSALQTVVLGCFADISEGMPILRDIAYKSTDCFFSNVRRSATGKMLVLD